MGKLRVLFFLIGLILCTSVYDTFVVAQTADRKAQDLAAIEEFHKQDIAATLSRSASALTDLWTDDAVRILSGQPPEVGKNAILESNKRWEAFPDSRFVSYAPETKDLTLLDGWAIEWVTSTVRM